MRNRLPNGLINAKITQINRPHSIQITTKKTSSILHAINKTKSLNFSRLWI
jgi:hypothetical protein